MIGFTCSTFDLLHAGHVEMLKFARQNCDELWVGLQTGIPDRPEKNQPVQTVLERYVQLEAVRWVDRIIPYESEADLYRLLKMLPLKHLRFIGWEYHGKLFTGSDIYTDQNNPGPELRYTSRAHGWSTTDLRKRASINS